MHELEKRSNAPKPSPRILEVEYVGRANRWIQTSVYLGSVRPLKFVKTDLDEIESGPRRFCSAPILLPDRNKDVDVGLFVEPGH